MPFERDIPCRAGVYAAPLMRGAGRRVLRGEEEMADALLRHWSLLRAIPRAPARRDVSSLHRALERSGYRITRRQLQRDLNSLSRIFPIQADERGPAFGWSWAKHASLMDLPAMDPQSALMLRLVEQFIPQLLPPVLSDGLQPYFARARQVLKGGRAAGLARWADCVRVVPREMPLLAPRLDREATRVVYDALLAGKRFTARYTSRTAGPEEPAEYEISPLGIVVRGNVIYLLCTLWGYQDVRQLAVHRLTLTRLLEKPVTPPVGFDLDRYIQGSGFQYPLGPPVVLKALFTKEAAAHLAETALSEDQAIEEVDARNVLVTATVANSRVLEWWLRSLGEAVRVLEPAALRERVWASLAEAARRYMREEAGPNAGGDNAE